MVLFSATSSGVVLVAVKDIIVEGIIKKWLIVKVAREHNIVSEIIEAYAFPPVIRY